jgi:hypothetical protein
VMLPVLGDDMFMPLLTTGGTVPLDHSHGRIRRSDPRLGRGLEPATTGFTTRCGMPFAVRRLQNDVLPPW